MQTSDGSTRPAWYRPSSGPSSGPLRRAEPGNGLALVHGVHSARVTSPAALEVRAEVVAALPMLAAPAFAHLVDTYAQVSAEILVGEQWLDANGGWVNERGGVRPVAEHLDRLRARQTSLAKELGLTPHSLALLGTRLVELRRAGRFMQADLAVPVST
jgi:hypothetical protein